MAALPDKPGNDAGNQGFYGFLGRLAFTGRIANLAQPGIQLPHYVVGNRIQFGLDGYGFLLEVDYFLVSLDYTSLVGPHPLLGGMDIGLETLDVLLYLGNPALVAPQDFLLFILILPEGLQLLGQGFQLQPGLVYLALGLNHPLGQELALLFLAYPFHRQAVHRLLDINQFGFHRVDNVQVLFQRKVDIVYLFLDTIALGGLCRKVGVPAFLFVYEATEAQQVQVQLGIEDIVPQGPVAQGLLGLDLEGVVAALDLRQDAVNLAHVLFGALKLQLGLPGPGLVLGDACGFLEKVAPFFGLAGQDLVDTALLHHRVGALAYAGIPEQLPQLLEPGWLVVYVVFAFP
jgi:hypothetical protein